MSATEIPATRKPGGDGRRNGPQASSTRSPKRGAGTGDLGPPSSAIPDKLYFRIGEVAELCRVETFVLRYWQTEFPQLKPGKSGTGQRLYRRRDVETALRIKRLLHEEGYTIAGARGVLAAERATQGGRRAQPELPLSPLPSAPAEAATERAEARLAKLRAELRELLGILSQPPGRSPSRRSAPEPERGPRLFTDE